MLMPEVHSCMQMVAENDKLKKLVRRIKRENESLKEELAGLKEEKKLSTLLKQYVTSRETGSQTDTVKILPASGPPQPANYSKRIEKPTDNEKLSKMMVAHNNLMRRYEKELKVNMDHLETITALNLKVSQLQQKQVELEHAAQCKPSKFPSRKEYDDLSYEMRSIKKDRDNIARDNKKLKRELEGLDFGFFEEVEDLKFALQQSAKLSKEYESYLKKMCKQYGVPFPSLRLASR